MTEQSRSLEIDLLRVLAIGLMMSYHTAYDLGVFYGWSVDVFHGFWWIVGKSSAALFLLLVGISFQLSWNKNPNPKRILKRGIMIFCYGMVVTVATYIFDPLTYVRFGILHLIGVSIMLLPLLKRIEIATPLLGILLLFVGNFITKDPFSTSLLIPLGFLPRGFISIDYYPLIPWFGWVVLGMTAGKFFLQRNQPTLFSQRQTYFRRIVSTISKKSLLIYMLHQPILLGAFSVFL